MKTKPRIRLRCGYYEQLLGMGRRLKKQGCSMYYCPNDTVKVHFVLNWVILKN